MRKVDSRGNLWLGVPRDAEWVDAKGFFWKPELQYENPPHMPAYTTPGYAWWNVQTDAWVWVRQPSPRVCYTLTDPTDEAR